MSFHRFSASRYARSLLRSALAATLAVFSCQALALAPPDCQPVAGGDWRVSGVADALGAFAMRAPGAYGRAMGPLKARAYGATGGDLRNTAAALIRMLELSDAGAATPVQLAEILNNIATIYVRSTCREEALRLLVAAEALMPREDNTRAIVMMNQAAALIELDRLDEAAATFESASKLLPSPSGWLEIEARVAFLNNASVLARRAGYAQAAEARIRDELALLARPEIRSIVGDEQRVDGWVAALKLNLAVQLAADMQRDRIGSLLDDVVQMRRTHLGLKHEELAKALRARARQRSEYERKPDLAIADLNEANAILLEENQQLLAAMTRIDIALIIAKKGDTKTARQMMEEAVGVLDRNSVPPNARANAVSELANLYAVEGRAGQAVPLLTRAVEFRLLARGGNSPQLADDLHRLAEAQLSASDLDGARRSAIRAAGILQRWLRREAIGCRTGDPIGTRQARDTLHLAVRLDLEIRGDAALADAFGLLQAAELDRTGVAAQAAIVRKAAQANAALRTHQEALAKRCRIEQDLVTASQTLGPAGMTLLGKALEDAQAAETASEKALTPRDRRLLSAGQDGLTLAELDRLLRKGELLLSIRTGRRETFVLHARKREDGLAAGISIAPNMDEPRMAAAVKFVRRRLDSKADIGELRTHLFEISKRLLQGVPRELFSDVTQFVVAADGPMDQLPPHLLLRGDGVWLSDAAPVAVLPSLPTLRWLRDGPSTPSPHTLVARGNPQLAARTCDPATQADLTAAASCLGIVSATGVLMDRVGKAYGATGTAVLGRAEATVGSLSGVTGPGVLLFATHAVKARELPGLNEPALILSPDPSASGVAQSGVLPASEVLRLKLDGTGLVVLGVCNSAAPDDRPGAEGYTGLARAFLFAGARAVVVSHWYADADATSRLLEGALVGMAEDATLTVGEALRRAMAKVREKDPHPAFWAPFVVLGDAETRIAKGPP